MVGLIGTAMREATDEREARESSDEEMVETASQKIQRYQQSEQLLTSVIGVKLR